MLSKKSAYSCGLTPSIISIDVYLPHIQSVMVGTLDYNKVHLAFLVFLFPANVKIS